MAGSDLLQQQVRDIYRCLRKQHADAKIALAFSSPVELLIATILSAQCTDVKVNEVTKLLFKTFRKPEDYLHGPITNIEEIIRPTGFFRQKAKSIRGAMAKIVELHGSNVPKTMEELTALPGVGRKTANVVLGNAFSLPGLPVDTHVIRITNRLGVTKQTDPVKIEAELGKLLQPKDWCQFSHCVIFHGRRVCKARKPLCEVCSVTEWCDYFRKAKHERA